MDSVHVVYTITCTVNGRMYVGVSADPHKRFNAHARNPPYRMRRDAALHQPFRQYFELRIVESFACRHAAHLREARMIAKYGTRGRGGYNHLVGAPAFSQHFWVQHRRGKL